MRNGYVARTLLLTSALALGGAVACAPVKKTPPVPPPHGSLEVVVEHEDDTAEGSLVVSVQCVFDSVVAFDTVWEIPYGSSAGVADLGEGTVCDLERVGTPPPDVAFDPGQTVEIVAGPITRVTVTVHEEP